MDEAARVLRVLDEVLEKLTRKGVLTPEQSRQVYNTVAYEVERREPGECAA